jgi:raffinose/stachyose/melibiose transport system permease protein
MRIRYRPRTFVAEIALMCLALLVCVPLYLLFSVSVKAPRDLFEDPLAPPTDPHFGNYSTVWNTNIGRGGGLQSAMISSLVITISTVVSLIVIGSLCAYVIARRPGKLSNLLYLMFVLGIIIPFQLLVLPMFVALRHLGLVGTYLGMTVLWVGVLTPLTVFLYTGFVRSLPREYEEAALVDGASMLSIFGRVVFPLLRPITGTVAILTGLFVWNDFFASLIFLGGSGRETLPVAIYSFVGEYLTQWNLVFATVLIALLPLLLFFVIAQKQMIRGFASGIRG